MGTTATAQADAGRKPKWGGLVLAACLIIPFAFASYLMRENSGQASPDRPATTSEVHAGGSVDQTGEGGSSSGPVPPQHETSRILEAEAPPYGTTRVVIEATGRTMCVRDMRGINRLYQNMQYEWVAQRPTDGIRAWSYQSDTAEPRTYRYRWDTDPGCRTDLPIP